MGYSTAPRRRRLCEACLKPNTASANPTNASVEGESTALFIQRQIRDARIDTKLSRLARGIPVGVDLEYADQITLSHALDGRRAL